MMKYKISLFLGLCLFNYAAAEVVPSSTKFDKRTRTVDYNSQQVFKILAYVGFTTSIILEEGEKWEAHSLGDPNAWEFAQSGRYVFLRPLSAKKPDTNLFLLTNKRHYNFDLRAKTDRVYANNEVELFTVEFRYPGEIAKRKKLLKSKKQLKKALSTSKNMRINTAYQGCGEIDISPTAVYDNGLQTFFKFSAGTPIPAIYYRNTSGKEELTNYNVQNDWIAIHQTAKEFILRQGQAVACVQNLGFNPAFRNKSGTVSNDVIREVKGND